MPYPALSNYIQFFTTIEGSSNLSLQMDKLNHEIDDIKEHHAKDYALQKRNQFILQPDDLQAYSTAFNRRQHAIENLPDAETVEIKSTTPTMLGSGNPNVHEAGLHLLRPWGVPYISASSIKGALSSYLHQHGGPQWTRNPNRSDMQIQLFGGPRQSQSHIGSVLFTDAWITPENPGEPWFKGDIINPHHKAYYRAEPGAFPDGMDNPIPIQTSAMLPGIKFQFFIIGDPNERAFLKSVLLHALPNQGLGAKTTTGYGRFELVKNEQDKQRQILDADPDTLAELYQNHTWREKYLQQFSQRSAQLPFSENLRDILIKCHPQRVLAHDLQLYKPNYDQIEDQMKKSLHRQDNRQLKKLLKTIDPNSPDAQKVFDFCMEKRPPDAGELEYFLAPFQYGWETKTIDDQTIPNIIENLTPTSYPPAKQLRPFIQNAKLSEKEFWLEYYDEKIKDFK